MDENLIVERIKRVVGLFPDYRHYICDILKYPALPDILRKTLKHIEIREQGLWYLPPSGKKKPFISYDEIFSQIYEMTVGLSGNRLYGLFFVGLEDKFTNGAVFPIDNPWKDFSDGNYLPEIQIKILDAIYGPEWEKYLSFSYNGIPAQCVRKTKL